MRYEKHIFICTNQKPEGKACCGETKGLELVEKFRDAIKIAGLTGKIRAQRSGCLDACKHGPVLVVYPDGTYYGNVSTEDVDNIVSQHIIEGSPVTDKQIIF
jgi:(2Fe-2S) ferredoxin